MPTKAGSLSLRVLLILHDTRYIENSPAEAIALRNFSAKMRFPHNIDAVHLQRDEEHLRDYYISVVAICVS